MQYDLSRWLVAALLIGIPAARSGAQDWPNWRGAQYNGSSAAKNLPVKFSPTENVKWAADLPGPSAATPVISGGNVFVSSVDLKNRTLVALCLDRATGKVKWQHSIGSGYLPGGEGNAIQLDEKSNYASPSPVTDGRRVVFFFGNGDLAVFDPLGKKLWQRNLQKEFGDFAFQWTFASSPVLYGGKLYVQILQRNRPAGSRGKADAPSYLLALSPETGQELWRSERPTPAIMESREAYSTPIPHEYNGRKELVIAGGDFVTGHDPNTGRELWRWGTWNEGHREAWWRLVPSPVVGEGVVLVCAPKRAPVYAAKLGGSGVLGADALAWKSEDRSSVTSDVPTPLYYQGKFFILSDLRRTLSCVDPKTGAVVWSVPTPGREPCWASPTGADGKLYLMTLGGTVIVVDAATGKTLAENPMDEPGSEIRSTVAVAHGALFIRTSNKLYCIAKG
ncbi:MAG: PQQ-binding-like beta-propeller repeat protein [Capsulimonadales bacterium]|nr:PQQ-binding-like beta-propeller repeat protein [Capsulimonadales bacterium]